MEKQKKAFRESKNIFIKEVILNLNKKMTMEVDVSDYITERVLSIECEDEKWGLVAYFSKSLNEIERNYKIHDQKMLIVIRGLEN